jgi:hypothetical protein
MNKMISNLRHLEVYQYICAKTNNIMRPNSSLIIAFFLIFTQILIAQEPSKKQTEDWIIKKLQIFTIYDQSEFRFDEKGNFIQKFYFDSRVVGVVLNASVFPLKTIDAIQIFEEKKSPQSDEIEIVLTFYSSDKSIELYSDGTWDNPKFLDNVDSWGIALKKEVKQDDMINRIKKAFIHLIELNGGKLKKDVF